LGGLVIKQAMVTANIDPRFEVIKKSCYGLVFMATPHRGSDKANLGKIMANIWKISLTRPKTQLLEQLEKDSLALQDLSDDFRYMHSQFQIASFVEEKETNIGALTPKIMVSLGVMLVCLCSELSFLYIIVAFGTSVRS
jgi:hypothetical protein